MTRLSTFIHGLIHQLQNPDCVFILCLTLCGFICPVFSTLAQADPPTKTILLIGKDRDHPPRTHEYLTECNLLAKCLNQTPGIETIVSNGWPDDAALLERVDAIVLYQAMGGNLLSAPERKAQVDALLARGVGLVAIHWSTGADDGPAGQWQLDNLGGWFGFSFSKFPVRDSRVVQLDREHPVCRGWTDFDMRDEYYTGLKFHPRAQPLLQATIDGKAETIAWTYLRPGGGRSLGIVCGHFHDCFKMPVFRRVLVQSSLWAAGVDIPPQGAPCVAADADLTLPPDPREQTKQTTQHPA